MWEVSLEDFYPPDHFYLRCSHLSHVACKLAGWTWSAGFQPVLRATDISEYHLEPCLTYIAIMRPGPPGGFICLTHCRLWNGNSIDVFPLVHTQSKAYWGPLGLRKPVFQDATHRQKFTKTKALSKLHRKELCVSRCKEA